RRGSMSVVALIESALQCPPPVAANMFLTNCICCIVIIFCSIDRITSQVDHGGSPMPGNSNCTNLRMEEINRRIDKLQEQADVRWSSLMFSTPDRFGAGLTWMASLNECWKKTALPFVPKSAEDYQMYQMMRKIYDVDVWLPASDVVQEGKLVWFDGQDAMGTDWLIWKSGTEFYGNSADKDCLVMGKTGLRMHECGDNQLVYPGMCYKIAPFKYIP
ncbi:unnamed protein product, partial [Meganyctiphanes norvegica]